MLFRSDKSEKDNLYSQPSDCYLADMIMHYCVISTSGLLQSQLCMWQLIHVHLKFQCMNC